MSFTGELNDKMVGFYRSSQEVPVNGTIEKRWIATTQFEPTDARKAFPCWDEPAVKATFEISLVVSQDKVALSNMPVVETKPTG
jgi:puromycin-sensitive aminopeptidase